MLLRMQQTPKLPMENALQRPNRGRDALAPGDNAKPRRHPRREVPCASRFEGANPQSGIPPGTGVVPRSEGILPSHGAKRRILTPIDSLCA